MVVVPLLPVNAMSEEGYHVFVGFRIEVVYLVTLVDDICHHVWRRCVDYGGRHNIRHVSVILVLWNVELLVTEELTHSC
jgi:hypothetical protein